MSSTIPISQELQSVPGNIDREENGDVQLEFINSLAKRLESFLPNVTGYTLIEVELNPQFIVTKKLLVDQERLNMQIKGTDYISYCFYNMCKILRSINTDSAGAKIREKDDKILSSTLIILKILSELIETYWKSKRTFSNLKSEFHAMNFEILTNFSFYYHFDPPKSVNPKFLTFVIDTLLDLLSGDVIKRVLNLIQRRPIDQKQYQNNSSPSNTDSPVAPNTPTSAQSYNLGHLGHLNHSGAIDESFPSSGSSLNYNEMDTANILKDIDTNIEICFRFLAAACPNEYCNYLEDNLFRYTTAVESVSSHVLQKYSPLIKYCFYTIHNGDRMAKAMDRSLNRIRNVTWKQIILVFYSSSIRDQAFARPEDYDDIVERDDEVEAICKSMFDQTCSIFEELPYSGVASMVQTWISILNPSDYKEYELKPNKLKLSFNKKLKFINNLVKDCNNRSNLTCFDALITLFHLAGRFPDGMHSHPVYEFTMNHLDETYDSLTKLNLGNFSHNLNSPNSEYIKISFDNLVVNFFVAAIMLKPQKYINLLLNKYENTKDNFREIRIVVKVIKGLSEYQLTTGAFSEIIKSLAGQLKALCFNSSKLLSHYYDSTISMYSSSSSASIVSDGTHSQNLNRKLSFDQDLSPHSTKLATAHHNQTLLPQAGSQNTSKHQHSHSTYSFSDINVEELKFSSAVIGLSSSNLTTKMVSNLEDLLADLFAIFTVVPELFFNDFTFMNPETFCKNEERERAHIQKFIQDNVDSLKVGLQSRSINSKDGSNLFNSTCRLIMSVVDSNNAIHKNYNEVTVFVNHQTWKQIIKSICDSCVSLSLTDVKFKSNLIFLNQFLKARDTFLDLAASNRFCGDPKSHEDDACMFNSVERILLLSLCTHDIQFYNIVKETMKWYLSDVRYSEEYYKENLSQTFEKLIGDDYVFTGFVSLHKRFRNILREARPTKPLYQVWLIVYERWYDLFFNKTSSLNEENLLFRHFTGFLISTSGCFLLNEFALDDPDLRARLETTISTFFDRCIELLTSQDLVVRVIIKDALSNESHSAVYQLVSNKLVAIVTRFEESGTINEESILFTEQVIMIITAMVSIPNEGSILLTTMVPEICLLLIKMINLVEEPSHQLKLKLRFCKLGITLESNRERLLLAGAYKIRNYYAKASAEWLEQCAFYDEIPAMGDTNSIASSTANSKLSGPHSNSKPTSKESEAMYLNIDLAAECSKALSLQLENLLLDIPEGVGQNEVAKYKDLAFANYFSLFYKILTKFTLVSSTSAKPKYKIQVIVDNVLKCITNILQYDTDIGLQLVFPLGYHENSKIRSLFLSVFAEMLYERKVIRSKESSHTETLLLRIASITDFLCSASLIASKQSQNLYATSLFGIYGYLSKSDELIDVLLDEEVNNVARTSDIFRRNSTLTKLLAKVAKDYGMDYLTVVLKDFVEEFNQKEIVFNVEKEQEANEEDVEQFMKYLNKLVDVICSSAHLMPKSFKFICSRICEKVDQKVPDSGLVAVGSFVFLRFFCPAIISPEAFFDTETIGRSNKKSLLQLVKVIQNMANKTLSVLKWKTLYQRQKELDLINHKIFNFLEEVSLYDITDYPFESIKEIPIPELRYLHKFFYTYYKDIKRNYLFGDFTRDELVKRVKNMGICDQILKESGQPKPLLNMEGADSASYKNFDPSGSLSNEYTYFMNKMSAKYADVVLNVILIHNAIFHDGTPVVVVNLKNLKAVDFNVHLLVYKLFETASQVWDNKFYFVFDFTEFTSDLHLLLSYSTLLNSYGPIQLFKNCTKIYYFNLPIKNVSSFFSIVKPSNVEDKNMESRARFYTYSHCDSVEIISSLCLSEDTMSITRDKKVEFPACQVLDSQSQSFHSTTIRIGRQYLLFCSDDFVATNHELCVTKGFRPVEIFALSDITRCEITKASGAADEFTIYFHDRQSVIVRSSERLEILRFLYFTTSRLPKAFVDTEYGPLQGDISSRWFGRLFNIVFQSLLNEDEDVRSSASCLLASVSNYFEIDYSISREHAKDITFPSNTTNFIVAVSKHLASRFPEMSYRFVRAFFDYYDKLQKHHRMSAILYLSPWINNICDHIYLEDEQMGPDRVAGVIRQICQISATNKDTISAIDDYIWKKLFSEAILIPMLLDEIVAFAMDNRNDDPDWAAIISVCSPSAELCGETIKRLITCINSTTNDDSEVASESKLFEIMILVKMCASLFFDSYIFANLYLADIFFICTLFIDNPSLEFGRDLQKLVINTVQSFFNKPDLTEDEKKVVEDTLTYFSGQRAKMLFGLTREKSSATSDINQVYNKAAGFETLCEYLNDFIAALGSASERSGWRSRWCSYAMDVALSGTSLFQMRAMLVIGILSKTGVSDQIFAKMLKHMSRNSYNNSLEYMSNALITCSKMVQGLSPDSVLPPILIWPILFYGLLNTSALYQPSIVCLLNVVLKNFEQGLGFLDRAFEQKQYLNHFIEEFEKTHNIRMTPEGVVCYVFFVMSQGLKLSHLKHTSLYCLKAVFRERFVLEGGASNHEFETPPGILPHFFFVWLSCNETNFNQFIESTQYRPSKWVRIGELKIPKVLIDYLLSDLTFAKLVLYQAAYVYATPSADSGFKNRFLFLLNYLFSQNKEKGFMIYHVIKSELATTMINSNSTEIVVVVSDIMTRVMKDPSYSLEERTKQAHEYMREHGVLLIKDFKFYKPSELKGVDESVKQNMEKDQDRLREMMYRTASCYVENERLEN